MANIIDMPKLSDTMTVGTLIKWLKKEGDVVKSGDMLAEVETDKATMELESFFDGTLLKLFAPAGSQVAVGAPLCAVGKAGEVVEAPAGTPAPTAAKAAPAAAAPAVSAPAPKVAPAAPAPVQAPVLHQGRLKISPLAKKLAAELGVDATRVASSGPGGRIVRADILAAQKSGGASASSLNKASSFFATSGPVEDKVIALPNMRATIARRTQESKVQAPHIYLEVEADAGPLMELRSQLNSALEKEGVKLSVNDFILKACGNALRKVPMVNASYEVDAAGQGSIRVHGAVNVSFAVAIEDGLITPVVRDTSGKSLFAISTEAKSLAKLARDKKLQPAQYTGGTFCVSNMGMMGINRFSAIINQPNAAILAVGATVKKAVVVNDQIVIGQRMSLTISCDHRVLDGAIGATFLTALKELIEKPALLLI